MKQIENESCYSLASHSPELSTPDSSVLLWAQYWQMEVAGRCSQETGNSQLNQLHSPEQEQTECF